MAPFTYSSLHFSHARGFDCGVRRYFSFLEQCKDAKACTVLLRGGSKDVLNEVERNLADAMQVPGNPRPLLQVAVVVFFVSLDTFSGVLVVVV